MVAHNHEPPEAVQRSLSRVKAEEIKVDLARGISSKNIVCAPNTNTHTHTTHSCILTLSQLSHHNRDADPTNGEESVTRSNLDSLRASAIRENADNAASSQ